MFGACRKGMQETSKKAAIDADGCAYSTTFTLGSKSPAGSPGHSFCIETTTCRKLVCLQLMVACLVKSLQAGMAVFNKVNEHRYHIQESSEVRDRGSTPWLSRSTNTVGINGKENWFLEVVVLITRAFV